MGLWEGIALGVCRANAPRGQSNGMQGRERPRGKLARIQAYNPHNLTDIPGCHEACYVEDDNT